MGPVLITGATGFLGGALAAKLTAIGVPVVGVGRNLAAIEKMTRAGIRMVACDLSEPLSKATIDTVGGIGTVVHCAAKSSPWGKLSDFRAANVEGTHNTLALARGCGAKRVVHVSTPSVYFQFADQLRVSEDIALPPPVNAYAATKAMAEDLVRETPDLETVILRPRGIYGAGDTALLPRLLRVAQTRPIPRFRAGQGATDITHVDDVVAAIIAAMQSEIGGAEVFNISGGVSLSLETIIKAACAATGVRPRWRSLPFRPVLSAVRLAEAVARRVPGNPEPPVTAYGLGILRYEQTLDISKAQRSLNWTPQVEFADGLRRTFPKGMA